jgi:hypothetical protein
LIKIIKVDDVDFSFRIKFTPDGKYIINASNTRLSLIDFHTGNKVRDFEEYSSSRHKVDISINEKYLLSSDSGEMYSHNLVLWNIKTGEKLKSFSKKGYLYYSQKLSYNKEQVISTRVKIVDGKIISELMISDIETGKEVLHQNYKNKNYNRISNIPYSDTLLLADNNKLKFVHVNNDNTMVIEPSNSIIIDTQFLHHNGDTIVMAGINQVNSLDTLSLKQKKVFHSNDDMYHFQSSYDGKLGIYYSYKESLLIVVDLEKQQKLIKFKDESGSDKIIEYKMSISNDKKVVVILTSDTRGNYCLDLYNLHDGKHLREFDVDSGTSLKSVFFVDNKTFITNSLIGSDRIETWNIDNDDSIKTIQLSKYTRSKISRDLKKIIDSNGLRKSISIRDLKSGKQLNKIEIKNISATIYKIHLFKNSNIFLVSDIDHNVLLIDSNTAKVIQKFNINYGYSSTFGLLKNDSILYYLHSDGSTRFLNIALKQEVLKSYMFSDGEWLNITPNGYFDSSKNGAKYLKILTNSMEVSSIDQYYELFYRPDIIASALNVQDNKQYAKTKPTLKLNEVKPAPEVTIVDTQSSVNEEELQVTLNITPNSGGIGQIRLYVDDVLIKTDGDRGLQKKENKDIVRKTFTIKLAKGKHIVKAIVYNEANTMASIEDTLSVLSTYSTIVKPNIHAVVIGIDNYKNPAISLKYAVADAKLFAKTIKDNTQDLYGNVNMTLLIDNKQTTKSNITKTLKSLENISPNDLFIFFVASHGMIEDAKYHMITSNVGALSSRGIKKEAISQNTLRDLLANIPTTKKFIVLDTCNSGALGHSLEVALLTRGLTETTAMKVLSRAVGSTIISASSSAQEALEGYKGHGLLTYVLTDGLKGKADIDSDGYVKTLEIANFVEDNVPRIAEKEFNRAQYPYISPLGQGFPLIKVK